MRPITAPRWAYPRYVEESGSNFHGADYLSSTLDRSIFNWTVNEPYYHIPQIRSTYAYTLGSYGIQNEKQVSIGESTCGAVFFARPIYAPKGTAILHMPVLTEIALERCDTARCAVQLIGDLAVRYGIYGTGWDVDIGTARSEAGEALTISDTQEVW